MQTPHTRLLRGLAVAVALVVAAVLVPGSLAGSSAQVPTRAAVSAQLSAQKLVAAPAARQRNTCTRNSNYVPRCGVLWGMYLPPVSGPGVWKQPYAATEKKLGRRLDIVKAFYGFEAGKRFPNSRQRTLAKKRLLQVSWNAYDYGRGRALSYAAIARGDYDASIIRPQARALKSWNHRVIVDFDHEMNFAGSKTGTGTAAQYRKAYRHVVKVFRSVGATKVRWAWVTTGYNTTSIKKWYPGATWVDWVGYDPYNFYTCHGVPWRTARSVISGFYRYATREPGMRHKPLMLGEYGSQIGPKAGAWYVNAAKALRSMPRIKAVMQFSSTVGSRCNFRVGDHAATLRGFKKAGRSAYVMGVR